MTSCSMETLTRGYSDGSGSMQDYFSQFSKPSTDYSINKVFMEEILPLNPLDGNTTKIEYVVPASPQFTDLSQTTIEFTFHLLLENGQKVPASPIPSETEKNPYKGCGTIQYPIGELGDGGCSSAFE